MYDTLPTNFILRKLSSFLITALFTGVTFFSGPLMANPEGGTIVAGSASIAQAPGQTTINQSTDKAIIDWRGFSIDKGETTSFNQPSSSSMTLNRVTGGNISNIMGSLRANGQIILVNPAGIVFGAGSRVDAAGFIASTANIKNADFMKGNLRFFQDPSYGQSTIVNNGTITVADRGLVALVAPGVVNNGVINARLGKVALASGTEFTIDLYGDQVIHFAANSKTTQQPVDASGHPLNALVANHGAIYADGGRVSLSARAAENLVNNTINMDGVIEARSIQNHNGRIVLSGGNGNVNVSGTLDASGISAGQTGGTIKVLGKHIQLASTAKIDASGDAGGGTVLIGGNAQGKGPERNAKTTFVAAGATINASAISQGNGGKVVVWSNDNTNFQGLITAKGGQVGGNGGNAEVSGGTLNYEGFTNLLAPTGQTGTLLLDPFDITISNAATSGILTSGNTFTSNANSSVLNASTLNTALSGANVTVQTGAGGAQQGNITLDATASLSWSASTVLTLLANGNININGLITTTGNNAGVVLHADSAGTGIGTITGLQTGGSGVIQMLGNNSTLNIFYNPVAFPTADGGFAGGNGTGIFAGIHMSGLTPTFNAFMLVNNQTQLQNINANLAGDYALGKNIALTGIFTPIGNDVTPFTGIFNGNFNIIDGLTINSPLIDFIGLFGETSGATVKNVGLTNVNVVGRNNVGALIGAMINGTATHTFSSGSVSGTGQSIGGLIGINLGALSQSFSLGTVNATGLFGQVFIGGLVGLNNQLGGFGTITDSYSMANVFGGIAGDVGGLVGFNNNANPITNSYSIGFVTLNAIGLSGGIVGFNNGSVGLVNLFWNTTTSANLTAGAGVVATGLTTPAMQTQSSFTGFDFTNVWGITEGVSYPYLRWAFPAGPQVVSGTVFTNSQGTIPASTNNIVRLATAGAVVPITSPTFADGTYYYAVLPNTLANGNALLAYTSGITSTVAGTTAILGVNGNNATGLNIDGNLLLATGTGTLSNSQLVTAKGGIVDNGILFTNSGNNITTTGTTPFQTSASTPYNLDGGITTSNASVTFQNIVSLGADSTLSSGNGDITFGSTLNGNHNLALTTTGNTLFTGAVGNTSPLGSLTDSAALQVNGGSITTTGAQVYNGIVMLGNDTAFTNGNAPMTFSSTLNGNGVRNVNFSSLGNITFANTVGSNPRLGNVTVQNANNFSAQLFNATTFTQQQGTGLTNFATGLVTTGDISITTNSIAGNYSGGNTLLNGFQGISAQVNVSNLTLNGKHGGSVTNSTVRGISGVNAAFVTTLAGDAVGQFFVNGCLLPGGCSGNTVNQTSNAIFNQVFPTAQTSIVQRPQCTLEAAANNRDPNNSTCQPIEGIPALLKAALLMS